MFVGHLYIHRRSGAPSICTVGSRQLDGILDGRRDVWNRAVDQDLQTRLVRGTEKIAFRGHLQDLIDCKF